MLLIISGKNDSHVKEVEKYLRKKPASYFIFHPEDLLNGETCSFNIDKNNTSIQIAQKTINISNLHTVWVRKPYAFYTGTSLQSKLVFHELQSFIKQIPSVLTNINPSIRVINNYHNNLYIGSKLPQLLVAQALGFSTPKSLYSNKPDDVRKFYKENNNGTIVKVIENSLVNIGKNGGIVYTSKLKNLPDGKKILASPVLYQEQIHKQYEIRITVVGSKIFPVAFDSSLVQNAEIDFRRSKELIKNTKHWMATLPPEIAKKIMDMMEFFNISYATIDMAVDLKGNYIFFELNPNGQYLWLEKLVNVPISETLANFLTHKVKL